MPLINPQIGIENLQFQAALQPWFTDQTRVNYDDFMGTGGIQPQTWVLTGSGSGTTVAIADAADHPGLIEQNTGALSNAAQMMGLSGPSPLFLLTTGICEYRIMLNIVNLSSGVDRYIFQSGISDAAITGDVNNGIYFEYSDNINSGNWTLCAANGGVRTKVDSGIPAVAGSYFELMIRTLTNNGGANFYYNETLIGSVTTNIPASANTNVRPMHTKKQLGTTSRAIRCDYVFFGYSFRPGR